jgi:hypothetical protein
MWTYEGSKRVRTGLWLLEGGISAQLGPSKVIRTSYGFYEGGGICRVAYLVYARWRISEKTPSRHLGE